MYYSSSRFIGQCQSWEYNQRRNLVETAVAMFTAMTNTANTIMAIIIYVIILYSSELIGIDLVGDTHFYIGKDSTEFLKVD